MKRAAIFVATYALLINCADACSLAQGYARLKNLPASSSVGEQYKGPDLFIVSISRGSFEGPCSNTGTVKVAIREPSAKDVYGYSFRIVVEDTTLTPEPATLIGPITIGEGVAGFRFTWGDYPSVLGNLRPIKIRIEARTVFTDGTRSRATVLRALDPGGKPANTQMQPTVINKVPFSRVRRAAADLER